MNTKPARLMIRVLRIPVALALLVAFSSYVRADEPEHHGGNLNRPYRDCAACHGDNLEGANYGTIVAPSCFDCHDNEWEEEDNLAPEVDAGGPYSVNLGEAVAVDATATFDSDGDSLTYIWDFGDGYPRRRSSMRPTATHTYSSSGIFTGSLTVGDGYNPPVVVPFTVEVHEVPVYTDDVWNIATTESPAREFAITIEDYDGTLLVLQDDGVNPRGWPSVPSCPA